MASHIPINLFHVLVVAPFFIYVAIMRGQLVPWIFQILIGLGLLVLVYHAYKTAVRWNASSTSVWINIIHVVLVAPLLLYIGANAYDTPRWAYELLAMEGFAAGGYHLYSMVIEIQDMNQVKSD